MKPTYLEIAVPVPLRRSFHYLPPTNADINELQPGIRVEVPFGPKKVIGVLIKTTDTTHLSSTKIKPAFRLIDQKPVFHPTIFRLCCWAAQYYCHPVGEVLSTALPVLLRKGEPINKPVNRLIAKVDHANQPGLGRSPKQLALLEHLLAVNSTVASANNINADSLHQSVSEGLSKSMLSQLKVSAAVIKALVDKGYADWLPFVNTYTPFNPTNIMRQPTLTLNDEQSAALRTSDKPGCHLIFGITGSGKTEIYLQAIESVLRQGNQALVLVPEIGLTPQTVKRFQDRFQVNVFALHSGLSDKDRLLAWQQANQGSAAIIIGTRSAIFTPLLNPGLIVIDEEHDSSFKQQEGFRYSARDIAVLRGQWENIPVILGSATPALESYHNANNEKYTLSRLQQRANQASTANYRLIDIQHEKLDEGFSKPLIHLITQHLQAQNQVLIFLNRRGFSPVVMCRACGWIKNCGQCDARMTYHLTLNSLICHHCGLQSGRPPKCEQCASKQLIPLGVGTQRLEQSLLRLFPGQRVIRIDRDSTRRKGAMEKFTEEINRGEPGILVGTQLLAKGHHFANVTLVAVIDIDSGFYSADYKAIERMGQILLQVGGRAGRESKPGTVAIQTLFPNQPVLKILIDQGYEAFSRQLLNERQAYDLPPFAYQAIIRAEANELARAMTFLTHIKQNFSTKMTPLLLGPVPSNMEKRANKYRAQLLFSSNNRRQLQDALHRCIEFVETANISRGVKWAVDVDPIDLH